MAAESLTAHCGRLLHCLSDPGLAGDPSAVEYFDDGALIVSNGHIVAIGPRALLKNYSSDIKLVEHGNSLMIPGLIDCHVHYPQVDVIAAYGEQLLDWLTLYTFPEESRYGDENTATQTAEFFIDELLRNGTTTALVFATVHPESVNAIFSSALARNMRLAAGKVLMDRNCPENLQDTAETGYQQSKELLQKWHGQNRLHYAITPRFAPTSSDAQLTAAGKLAEEFPDVMIHTHLAENKKEVSWVEQLYPDRRSYLDVYKHFGLLRERAVFAHCIHLDEQDHQEFASAGAAMAFCPTSNLFLGSGLFDMARAKEHQIRVGLGTDIGAGTSFSLLQTLNEAYKVLQLKKQSLSSLQGFYLATLGAAEALYMDNKIGNFKVGKEADFLVLDANSTPLVKRRIDRRKTISDEWFTHMILGDDRTIIETYLMGELAYCKE